MTGEISGVETPTPSKRINSFRMIKEEILRRVRDRVWSPGMLIPNEEVLAQEFGCARVTVNRALRELAQTGLLERKRRAGTRVAAHPVREARMEIPLVRAEVEAMGAAYRFTVLSREVGAAPEHIRGRLQLCSDAEVLHVRCLHFSDSRPFQYEDRWICLSAVPEVREVVFSDMGPNEWLVRHAPFSEMEIRLSASASTADEARLLGVAAGDPLFNFERTTWLLDQPITYVRMMHAQDYQMILKS